MGRRPRSRSRSDQQVGEDDVALADVEVSALRSTEERRFGQHTRGLRRARGLTQDQLAERSGLSADTIRRLEHGAFSPSLDTLTKLCTGLELDRSTLFESFELNEIDDTRELLDLLATRTPREIKLAFNVLRAMFDTLDDLESTRAA